MSYVFHRGHAFLFSQESPESFTLLWRVFRWRSFWQCRNLSALCSAGYFNTRKPRPISQRAFSVSYLTSKSADFRRTWRPNIFCHLITCSPFMHWSVLNILGVDQANLDFKFKMAKAACYFWRSFLELVLTKETFTHKWNFLINFLLIHFSEM